jgi:heat shock protein HslJ
MRPVSLVVPLAALATACSLLPGFGGTGPDVAQGSWELVEGEVDGAPLVLPPDRRITFQVDGDEVGGTVCNHYFGTWGAAGIGGLGSTDMACDPPALMELESTYLGALQAVRDAEVAGEVLRLTGDGVDLQFTATPPVPVADLVDTTWELTTLLDGDTASSTVAGAEPATFVLRGDGTAEGSTGCRTFTGRWVEDGDEVLFTDLAMDGDCPDELWAQDDHVVAALGDGFRAQVDGQQLTVTSRDGDGLVYTAVDPDGSE